MRTQEQKEYHAAKEREYRQTRKATRDAALVQFGAAVSVLLQSGMSVGQMTDLIVAAKESS